MGSADPYGGRRLAAHGEFLTDRGQDGAGARPWLPTTLEFASLVVWLTDCAAVCAGHGHWPGRRAAGDRDVRAAVGGVLVAVVGRGQSAVITNWIA
jgi:hypothetical protein